jgi:hypothetical protein
MSTPDDYDKIYDEFSRHAPMDLVRTLLDRHRTLVRAELLAEGGAVAVKDELLRVEDDGVTVVDFQEGSLLLEVWVKREGSDG